MVVLAAGGLNSTMIDVILQGVDDSTIRQTALTPDKFSSGMAAMTRQIASGAVVPVAMVVLCIVIALQLQQAVMRFDAQGDALARTLFAAVLRLMLITYLALHAGDLVGLISDLSSWMNGRVQKIKPAGAAAQAAAVKALKDAVDGIDGGWHPIKQIRLFVLLFIPFIIAVFVRIGIQVAVVVIFFSIYMMMAFASIPVAFLGADETRQMGIAYLQAFASTCLRLLFLYVGLVFYRLWMSSGAVGFPAFKPGDDCLTWVAQNWGYLIIGSLVLGSTIILSQTAARAVMGR